MPTDNRKRAIRARMAATGEPYSQAARQVDQDQSPANGAGTLAWALLTAVTDPPSSGRGVDALDRDDLLALALAVAKAHQEFGEHPRPCPVVTLYPAPGGDEQDEQVALWARLEFDRPRELDLDRLASAVRHALVMRDRQATTVSARPVSAPDIAGLDEASDEQGVRSPAVAEQDWHTHALVRVVTDVETGSPYSDGPTLYRTGRVLRLWQTGRAGEPVDRTVWKTSFDVDLMHFLPDSAVEVVDVLQERPPLLADRMESAAGRYGRRWARMAALFASARADATMTAVDWAILHDHRADLTRDLKALLVQMCRDGKRPEAGLLIVAADLIETVVTPEAAAWAVQEARTAADELRALAEHPHAGAALRYLDRAETVLTTALRADGYVSLDLRMSRSERDSAEIRLGARLAAVVRAELPG